MRQISRIFLWVILALFSSSSLYADVDINAGKKRAKMCLSCHGQDGKSQADNTPNLAGQKPAYLVNQLRAFREGTRKNGIMNNMAKGLSNQEINNIAAFFTSLKAKSSSRSTVIKKGKDQVAMCIGCHGPQLEGRGMAPRLAGQHSVYLKKQLQNFKSKQRVHGMMNHIASRLSKQDMAEITNYIGSL